MDLDTLPEDLNEPPGGAVEDRDGRTPSGRQAFGPAGLAPCPLCGYHAPGATCPHCRLRPEAPTLRRRRSGPLTGVFDGLWAVPHGLWILLTHRGLKRWMLPPLVLTIAVSIGVLIWSFEQLELLVAAHTGGEVELARETPGWLGDSGWLESTWLAGLVSVEWLANLVWGLVASKGLHLVVYFLIGSLLLWYCFSIVYEAFAGPFLDEVQARLEARWFRSDPRSRLERPNDLPAERCLRLVTEACILAGVAVLAVVLLPVLPWWTALVLVPAAFLPGLLREPRYGAWLRWVAHVEGRAIWASVQASILTTIFLVLALPLYFFPGIGYFLFAGVTGFATAVSLLDIPFERRGWPFRMRIGFVFRNLLAFLAFGIVAGALLAIPLFGPILMVPAASVGGLWLVCRLDKASLRPVSAPRLVASDVGSPGE